MREALEEPGVSLILAGLQANPGGGPIEMPTPSPSPTAQQSDALQLQVGGDHLWWVILALVAVSLVVVVVPLILQLTFKPTKPEASASTSAPSFFQIPYITWYLLHYGVAALAILGIILLAVDGAIDKGVVSALLGSLLGYVLGSASQSRPPTGTTPPVANGGSAPSNQADPPVVKGLDQPAGPAAGGTTVTLTGTGFTADAAVAFGGVSAKTVVFKSPTQLEVVTPPGASGAAVPVVVSVGSRSSSSTTGPLFTYQ